MEGYMLLPDIHPVPYPPCPSPSPPAVRPYDASNKLGSITVELNFLDAGPKSVKGCILGRGGNRV